MLHRNTFGTQPDGGWVSNVGRIALKNPANTHIAVSWGGKCLALWEAALPSRIDSATLNYVSVTFDGAGDFPDGSLTVTTGSRQVDAAVGAGVAFTAHQERTVSAIGMVGWTWAAPMVGTEARHYNLRVGCNERSYCTPPKSLYPRQSRRTTLH